MSSTLASGCAPSASVAACRIAARFCSASARRRRRLAWDCAGDLILAGPICLRDDGSVMERYAGPRFRRTAASGRDGPQVAGSTSTTRIIGDHAGLKTGHTMEIPKPREDDRQFFRSLIPDEPAVEAKP